MEQRIQHLRELAVIEVLFSNDNQTTKSPDLGKFTTLMWLKPTQLMTQAYSYFLVTLQWNEGHETVDTMTRRLQTYKDTVHALSQTQSSDVEADLTKRMGKLEERTEERHQKLRKKLKEDLLQVSSVQTRALAIRSRCSPAREMEYTTQADLWFFLHEHGVLGFSVGCAQSIYSITIFMNC
ncbi:hypothetical protein HGM15179_017933 [Zosterops borbonicus]|uniref:Uncharacterized protein n=1 Tax=Zosterops borbonicus TaxID=364589 RepID=A0A8K1G021_9PASS|nr:hypothetical protein HGM15179_017933 [Zosterops borbonicus]